MKKEKEHHLTAEKITKAAENLFLAKGFKGTSINEIAEKAEISKSLIYHHFKSKEDLWKAVKSALLRSHTGQNINTLKFPMNTFKDFLRAVITFRFDFYDKNPNLARLILWQRLEEKKDDLLGVNEELFITFVPQINEFQLRGEIRHNLDPEMVSYLITTTSSLAFMDPPFFFERPGGAHRKEVFLEMLIECLYLAFSAHQAAPLQPRAYYI